MVILLLQVNEVRIELSKTQQRNLLLCKHLRLLHNSQMFAAPFFFAEIFQTVIDRSMILSLQRRLRLSVCYIKLLFDWDCIFRICNLPLVSNIKLGLCFLLLAIISQNSGGRSLHFPPNNVATFSFLVVKYLIRSAGCFVIGAAIETRS